MGRVGKGQKCSVAGCSREAARSISIEKVKSAGLNVSGNERRAYICRDHYKEFKKKTKKDKTLDKWRYGH
jgi:thymidine kinase